MKKLVCIPITGSLTFVVEAGDDDEAIAKAWKLLNKGEHGSLCWEATESVLEGNVFCGELMEIEVEDA